MKQNLLIILTVAMALSASAQQNSQIVCQWTGMIDGTTAAGDQSTDVCTDKSGNVYWLGVYGTNPTNQDIKFNGQYLFTGDTSDADNSQNNNYTLLKTDADGNKLWAVYSTVGDFANNAGGCAMTSDGGLVTISKVRHSKYGTDKNITLVDATGSETKLDWTCNDRYYRIMVNKISAAGNIEWTRLIDVSTQPGPAASGNYSSFWPDCINVPGGCVVDSEDNIYLPVNYRNPVTIAKADGTSVVLTPVNNKAWSGDSQ
ncbi:MAG: hypothetical protein K2M76_06765, partial [Muribaculaceae bacterium]|nr:hypothetical protein [Muribaculaceae bacterium]